MQLFYHPNIKPGDTAFSFSKEESRHISKVLRKQPGDHINITDGRGNLYLATIVSLTPKSCECTILSSENQSPLPYRLHLAVAPTKLNDRFEWFLEKATEIGISEITPIICDNSERKVIKHERMERILQAAMKQSLKAYLPKLNPICSFNEFMSRSDSFDFKGIAHCFEGSKTRLKDILNKGGSACIMIGPEGDFSMQEIEKAIAHGFQPLDLGKSRLRTETAAVVAVHSVAFIND